MIKYCAFLPHPPILLKEIGGPECSKIKATTQSQIIISKTIKNLEKETALLVIMSPHAPTAQDTIPVYLSDLYSGNLENFGRPDVSVQFNGSVKLSQDLCRALNKQVTLSVKNYSELDHGVLVPLFELAKLDYQKPILFTGLNIYRQTDHFKFGQALAEYAHQDNKNIIFIGSGDMSHALKDDGPYAYDPAGPKFDQTIVDLINSGQEQKFLNIDNLLQENAAECGFRSLLTIAGIINKTELTGKILSYEGPFGVGYLAAEWRK